MPHSFNNQRPTNTISVTVQQGPQNTTFLAKDQTHATTQNQKSS